MSRRSRRTHSPAFKAQVALASLRGEESITQIAARFEVHSNQVHTWKNLLAKNAANVFVRGGGSVAERHAKEIRALKAQLEQSRQETDFVSKLLGRSKSIAERRAQIDRTHPLSIVRQCAILGLNRATAYYQPKRGQEG